MRRSLLVLPVLLVACGDASPSSQAAADAAVADTAPSLDDAPADTVATVDAVTDAVADATPSADASCAEACASLTGKVQRKPLTKPQNGGKGDVYVAVFDRDPVLDRENAKVVGQVIVADADMTADTASVAYTIEGLPPRAEPYAIVAFLDDNHTASGATPGPDKGDLVSLDGIAAPKVTVSKAGVTTFDLALNAVLPF